MVGTRRVAGQAVFAAAKTWTGWTGCKPCVHAPLCHTSHAVSDCESACCAHVVQCPYPELLKWRGMCMCICTCEGYMLMCIRTCARAMARVCAFVRMHLLKWSRSPL